MSSSVDAGGSRVGKDFWGGLLVRCVRVECVREYEVDESYSGLPRGKSIEEIRCKNKEARVSADQRGSVGRL